jgi:large subunit ribosomal protein L35
MKTHKATAKRVQVTKTGKLLKRHGGQDHFNARNSGKISRKKRRDQSVADVYVKNIKTLIPHA